MSIKQVGSKLHFLNYNIYNIIYKFIQKMIDGR